MSPESEIELEQARHRAVARHHRQIAERLGRAGYHDLASSHRLEAKLEELESIALAAPASPSWEPRKIGRWDQAHRRAGVRGDRSFGADVRRVT